jgi:hypothetical protein
VDVRKVQGLYTREMEGEQSYESEMEEIRNALHECEL